MCCKKCHKNLKNVISFKFQYSISYKNLEIIIPVLKLWLKLSCQNCQSLLLSKLQLSKSIVVWVYYCPSFTFFQVYDLICITFLSRGYFSPSLHVCCFLSRVYFVEYIKVISPSKLYLLGLLISSWLGTSCRRLGSPEHVTISFV